MQPVLCQQKHEFAQREQSHASADCQQMPLIRKNPEENESSGHDQTQQEHHNFALVAEPGSYRVQDLLDAQAQSKVQVSSIRSN